MARKDRPETSLLPVEQAQELALQGVRRPPAVKTPLSDAIGLVLSDDVVSDRDMPPFDRAAVDGYAVVASDLQSAVESAPVLLSVVEEVQAGVVPTKAVATGHTSKVMTGAPTPAGADAMVMVERTRSKHGSVVEFTTPVTVGQNIRPQGEDARKGDRVLGAGQVVGPPEAGILTSVGVIDPVVYPRPTLAVLSTGDEVVDPSQQPKPGQIRDSNGPLLTAQARRAGVEVTQLGIASDTFESLSRLIEQGLKSDVLVIAGGVSMGDHDIVEDVLLEFGFEMSFDRVNMKPGKPTVFGR
ncbi:MAG: molybdopterin molybdotransferase MoeA, partial [Candidatus Latescibacteria bacterium]|nr:molybdopterin molybdotransferase MoeA [Candidatus Latescibacterota bacterium]